MFMKRKIRIPETYDGIQLPVTVSEIDIMQREMRDKNRLPTEKIIKSGMNYGLGLEIGPGPGYLGLEWLVKTKKTHLYGLEISPAMINTALKNSLDYNLSGRVSYYEGNALFMPFSSQSFDFVFSNGSLHEWEEPVRVFLEIHRVLKDGGRFFISDLKRNISSVLFSAMKLTVNPKSLAYGFESSVNAAYTKEEITEILGETKLLEDFSVSENPFGLCITGRKKN